MPITDKFFIGGAWTGPSGSRAAPVVNPATNQQIGVVALGDGADVDRAAAAATNAFSDYGRLPKADRLALLDRLLAVTTARQEDLAQAISAEMGAPISMARSDQAAAGVGHLEGFIAALKAQPERETLPNGDIVTREPIGVCGLITP